MAITVAQSLKIVELMCPATDAAGRTSAYISLKHVRRCTIQFHVAQGAANTILLTLLQATNVAAAGSKAITNNVPIWRNLDCAASDTLVRDTDAKTYTTDAGVKHKIVEFQIDPALCMDVAGSFDCIAISTGASNAANLTEAIAICEMDYEQATPPSVIID
jgi:hypothetical protein